MTETLSMAQKVLLSLYRIVEAGRRRVRYEDIVVQAYKDYPAEFHLKGYPAHPDSGDAVHKPLYDYRKRGMVTASNKMFSLSPRGIAEAERLIAQEKGQSLAPVLRHRLERDAQIEINRIKRLESLKLFLENKTAEIIDSDLFDYLGATVRTKNSDFTGRLETVRSAVDAASRANPTDPQNLAIRQFHEFMMARFAAELRAKTGAAQR